MSTLARSAVLPKQGRLELAIERAWRQSTSAEPDGWSADNPARGQCAVTALVVQDYCGGRLLRGVVDGESHYWNILDDGRELDLTLRQFRQPARVAHVQNRERDYVLSFPDTRARYKQLRSLVDGLLGL